MRRVLKWLGLSLLVLVGLVLGAAVVVVARPQLVINDRVLARVPGWLSGAGVHLSWDRAHVEVASPGFLSKRLRLELDGVCVGVPSAGVDGCADRLHVAAAGEVSGLTPRVTELGPVELLGGKVQIAPPPSGPTPPEEKGGAFELPGFLQGARVMPLRVELKSARFVSGPDSSVVGGLDLRTLEAASGARVRLDAHAEVSPGKQRAQAQLELTNERGFLEFKGWRLSGDLSGGLPDGSLANARVELTPKGEAYTYSVRGDYKRRAARIRATVAGELAPDAFAARVSATVDGLVPGVRQVGVRECALRLDRRASETWPSEVKVDCPVFATVPELPPGAFAAIEMPAEAGARVIADLKGAAFPPSADSRVEGQVTVELSPILSPIFEGSGKITSQVAGVPAEFPRAWKMDTDLALGLRVPSFKRLVKQLEHGPLDVWAPLRVLEGDIVAQVQGRFDAQHGSAPVRLTTRLSSPKQKLDIDATGTLRLDQIQPSPRAFLGMDVALSQIRLELPPLPSPSTITRGKVDPMPQLVPDDRISMTAPATPAEALSRPRQAAGFVGSAGEAFSYDVRVHTVGGGTPIQLLSPDAKTPIPVGVRLALKSGAPLSGQVQVLGFPLELFRRDVRLEHLTLDLASPAKDSALDGRIVFKYTDYTISILVLGTTEKPQIRFVSDPPLPDDQIIAVLVFGQKLDALDPDQMRTVGSSRTALRQGALSLLSLYYLSSVNIESVDYDPATRTAAVRYKLAEGTSLNLSRGFGDSTDTAVGIRKRLSRHLAITTTLNNPGTSGASDAKRTVSTFLEWAYQY